MKKCTKCRNTKSESSFYERAPGILRSDCKTCCRSRTARNNAPKRAKSKAATAHRRKETRQARLEAKRKRCTQCGVEHSVDGFHMRKASIDGLSPICKLCAIANQADRYKAMPEQCRAVSRAWYQKNKTRYAGTRKRWMDENREQYLTKKRQRAKANAAQVRRSQKKCVAAKPLQYARRAREHYERNRERVKQRVRDWVAANPELVKHYRATRSARVRGAGGRAAFKLSEWKDIIEYFCGLCAYCLEPMVKPTKDHVDPVANGGAHRADNIVPACLSCNTRKQDKTLLQLVMAGHGVVRHSRARAI